jgi:hypothetical protein
LTELAAAINESVRQIGCNRYNDDDINAAVQEIRLHSRSRMMVRGKYILWFFLKQCESIWESIPKLSPNFSSKPKKRIECGIKNAMVILGPRVHAPESLKEFIRQNYLSFINKDNNA